MLGKLVPVNKQVGKLNTGGFTLHTSLQLLSIKPTPKQPPSWLCGAVVARSWIWMVPAIRSLDSAVIQATVCVCYMWLCFVCVFIILRVWIDQKKAEITLSYAFKDFCHSSQGVLLSFPKCFWCVFEKKRKKDWHPFCLCGIMKHLMRVVHL